MITETTFLQTLDNLCAYKDPEMATAQYAEICFKHAQCLSIGFAKWLSSHRLDFQPAGFEGAWVGVDMVTKTSEELFELYLKSKEI